MLSTTSVNLRYRKIHKATKGYIVSTIRPLQQHHYTFYDLQYVFLFVLFSFCYYIMEKPVWFKLPIALFATGLLIPKKTRQFMLPFLAIAAWLILFYCCRFIPAEWRPHIFTSVLPALENILYGGNISELLATTPSPAKDLLAWMPYGVLHFVLPFVTAGMIVFFAPAGTLPVFARTFGYMNVAGVMTQLLFPCAPPWYETHYGALEPATYSMPGDPGGLARVDDILGTSMYKSTFTASPMVFGAFPSLHSACAWQLGFFWVFIFGPRAIPVAVGYVLWIWWSTMYLGHHYVVDLVGGAGYAVVAFWIGSFFLPSVLPDYHNAKAAHVIHDLGETMNHQEKQTLFDAAHEDFVGFKINSKEWDYHQEEEDFEKEEEESVEEMTKVVVVSVESEIEEEQRTLVQSSEPSSPTGSMHSTSSSSSSVKKSQNRQSWNGWQGYESWMEVLATVNSPRTSPRTSPATSPRNSTTHLNGYRNSRRFSRDSMHSTTSSVVTLNLDVEANAAAIQGILPASSPSKRDSFIMSSLSTIEEVTGPNGSSSNGSSKGRSRPSRLILEKTLGSPRSLPNSPLVDHFVVAEVDEIEVVSVSSTSRPTSPRSFGSGSASPLSKGFKFD
ncbi:Aureobasidin resistance protein Aur1 [Podila humilis]|nr:Aureobasidin resistance protein Aur1 [Podila humilis]